MTSVLILSYVAGGLITLGGYYYLRWRKRRPPLWVDAVGSNEVTLIIWCVVWPLFLPLLIWSAFFRKDRTRDWVRHDEEPDGN